MNSDNILESEFFNEHKGFFTVIITISLAFLTIFWLYKGLTTQGSSQDQQNNLINKEKLLTKKKLTFFVNDVLFEKDSYKLNLPFAYELLDELAKNYNLFLIVFISNNDDMKKIITEFSPVIEDKIVEEHKILFTTNIEEGVSAFIRSLDPYAHIETNFLVVKKMIRFVNEFWIFNYGKIFNLEEQLKENYSFISKIKMFNEPKELLENLINSNSKI